MNEAPSFRSNRPAGAGDAVLRKGDVRNGSQIVPPAGSDEEDEIDIFRIVATVWRGKYWIALCVLVALFIGGYQAYVRAVPIYTARAIIVLENQQSSVVDIDSVVSGISTDLSTLNTELEVLKSRNLIGKLVTELNLLEDPEFNAQLRPDDSISVGTIIAFAKSLIMGPAPASGPPSPERVFNSVIDSVLRSISVANPSRTYVFRITAETQSPNKSAKIANTLADLYINDQIQVKFDKTRQATEWLSERVTELQSQVEASAQAVKEFRANANIVSPEALEALNLQIKSSRDRLDANRAAQQEFMDRLAALRAARETGDTDEMLRVANDRFLARAADLIDPNNPASRDAFDSRYTQIVSGVEVDLARVSSQEALLQSSLTEQAAEIEAQSNELVKLQQLEREVEANRLIYEYFLTRLKETSVQEGIQQADSRMLSPAVAPRGPSAPRKSMILAMSAFLGLAFGAGTVLLREMRHAGFRTGEDLEQITGHTVMGQIPKIPGRKRMSVITYVKEKPASAAAEAIRNLRTSLLLSNVDNPPQIIMTTSSLPGEGKTTLSISLALNLAGMGKNVLLVEGDIRRRTFGEYFKIDKNSGLLSVVSGQTTLEDAVFRNKELGVDILMGERSSTNAADFFSSERFREFIQTVREKYDAIIIDTPPVLVVPDARVIGQHADAIVYSVLWDKTSRSQVLEGLRQFRTVGLHVSGLALSRIDPGKMKKYGYGQQYGAYAAYGSKGYYDN